MSEPTAEQILSELTELKAKLRPIVDRTNDSIADGDTARKAASEDGIAALAAQLTALDTKYGEVRQAEDKASAKAAAEEAVKEVLHNTRKGSLAGQIAANGMPAAANRLIDNGDVYGKTVLKALFRDYEPGELLGGLMNAKGIGAVGFDPDLIAQGKATLASLGVEWAGAPGKATLGTTNATGGFVLPNNLVDQVIKPHTAQAVYQNLVTVRNGINVRGVDQPIRQGAAAIATFQPWGNTKSNLNETYGSYTANLGTLALVYDQSKQYARFSQGSAEQDVMDELTKGFILAENLAILAGNGTVNTGTGDPTVGVFTALGTAINNAYLTNSSQGGSFSPSATTQAGSAANGFQLMRGQLASRARTPTAIVTDAITYWVIIGQGTDTAGFWVSPAGGPTAFTTTDSGQLNFWGIPVYYDPNYNANTGVTKHAIMGDWSQVKLFRGLEFRIDTSDVAGTRWDQNVIGFRGEEEIGVNATAAVYVGAFQRCTNIIA